MTTIHHSRSALPAEVHLDTLKGASDRKLQSLQAKSKKRLVSMGLTAEEAKQLSEPDDVRPPEPS